jgi:hypothetical protein
MSDDSISTSTRMVECIHAGGDGDAEPVRTDGDKRHRPLFLPSLESFAATEACSPVTQKHTAVSLQPLSGFPVNCDSGSGRWWWGKPLKH